MKNAPCARFGIRIRPKISEKPDDSRNSRPPKATLLSVWMIQNCHCIDGPQDGLSEAIPIASFSRRDSLVPSFARSNDGYRFAQPILWVLPNACCWVGVLAQDYGSRFFAGG